MPELAWALLVLAVGHLGVAVGCSLHVLLQDKRPVAQLAWIVVILLVPIVGCGAYLAFGTDRLQLRRLRRRSSYRPATQTPFRPADGVVDAAALDGPAAATLQALSTLSGTLPTMGNRLRLLPDAATFYPALRQEIVGARRQIWLSFFVWRDDEVGRDFVRLLADAARRGVEVRLLLDEMGSRHTDRAMFVPLEEASGRFSWAMTLFPRRNRWFVNLRNHRKIVVVDGHAAFTGGMNIGCEYVFGVDGNDWHDMQVRIEGPAVSQLAATFADDWHFATDEVVTPCARPASRDDGSLVQLVSGGPDDEQSTIARSVEALVSGARERIVLTTPYFVPDEALLAALEVASARGVSVRLLISAETDMGPMLVLSRSFYRPLLAAGVEIREYDGDIHHAKLILVDDDLALVGSINLDVRSFHLNYEVGIAVRDRALVEDIERSLAPHLAASSRVGMEDVLTRPVRQRIRQGCLRLLAPLM